MTSTLQNRLIGTIIVVALVVIFLPEVLDGEKSDENQSFIELPERPDAIVIEPAEPFPQDALDAAINREVNIVEARALDDEPGSEVTVLSADDLETQAQISDAEQSSNESLSSPDAPAGDSQLAQQDTYSEDISSADTSSEDTSQEAALAAALDASASIAQTAGPGWVVQLGSFRYEKNVNELIATLNEAGYKAFSRPVQTSVGRLNKVFVGPELNKERLEQALPELQELTNLKGKITAFDVSD